MTTPHSAPSAADLDAARLLLARLGVSPADLLAAGEQRAPAPTFAEYIPVVRAAVAEGTRRVYGAYRNLRGSRSRPTYGVDRLHAARSYSLIRPPRTDPEPVDA